MIVAFNKAQAMWVDVIYAALLMDSFNIDIGDMNYVFRNMIAKFASSAEKYFVSEGVEELIDNDDKFKCARQRNAVINLRQLFYGSLSIAARVNRPTMFEHSIPAAIVRDELLNARLKYKSSMVNVGEFRAHVEMILRRTGRIVIVLKEENRRLSRSKMPPGWVYTCNNPENDLARYRDAAPPVNISKKYTLLRDERICR